MQFKQFLVIIAAALPVVIAASLPERALSCKDPKHPCNTYSSFPDCSAEYIKTLKECESTGCIQWIIDPLAHCNCDSPFHACNTYSNYKDCSPEYIADLKKCIPTGCINWIQDPLAHCKSDSY